MGGPMADHVFLAGHDLTVYSRSPERAEPFRANGVPVAGSLEELGAACDQIYLCVRATEDVQECVAALIKKAKKGSLFVDHSTILPAAAEKLHKDLGKRRFRFIDAPITGGSMGARQGTLTIFCGGNPEDIVDALPVLSAYGKRAECVGGPGAGQRMKMANQIAVAGSLLALCESMAYAEKSGLNLSQTRELLAMGAAGSWAFENYGPKILERDWSPGFMVQNQIKDLVYCESAAKEVGAFVPGTKLVHELLDQMVKEGHGEWTTAALFEKLMES